MNKKEETQEFMLKFGDERINIEIDPNEPHDVKFKPKPIVHFSENNTNRYAIEKPECEICGAIEETKICNRTFYS